MVEHSQDPSPGERPGQDSDALEVGGADSGGGRVAKALARAGVASRREVERLIEAGRVALNGQVLTTPAVKVSPGDILTVDGKMVSEAEPTRLWRYHKPVGLVTSHRDPQGRPTVFEALPAALPRVISIGRLDLNSEGLLLLTNDGALARALELPSSGWVRRYRARARGRTDQARLDRLKQGVTVEGVSYGPIDARLDKLKEGQDGQSANVWITVAISEGKNREVRRVLESIGLQVNRLIRLSYGPFQLGTLTTGEVEEVGPRVIREQLEAFIAPQNMPIGERARMDGPISSTPGRRPAGPGKRALGDVPGARSADSLLPEARTPMAYKTGWAKPKPKGPPRGPSKAPPKGAKGSSRSGPKREFHAAPHRAGEAASAAPAPRSPAPAKGGARSWIGDGPRPDGKVQARPQAKSRPGPQARPHGKAYGKATAKPAAGAGGKPIRPSRPAGDAGTGRPGPRKPRKDR
jgi:23S rRNA pseudouridine2605 synthase